MKRREVLGLDELPPEEHAIGIYAGLFLGALILGIGAGVLTRDFYISFRTEGLQINTVFIFRVVLLMLSAYGSLACFFGLIRIIHLQRAQVRKVDQEFKDFIMYARPLVEEIIRQRIIGERLTDRLEQLSRRERAGSPEYVGLGVGGMSRWAEFLLYVALMANISVGIFIYLEQHPWHLVPYSVIILGVAWWLVVARYFGLVFDERAYYLPAVFILMMPTLSVLLRAYMEPYEVLYVVFGIMVLYILFMYSYFKYLTEGELPKISLGSMGGTGGDVGPGSTARVPRALRAYLPPEGRAVPSIIKGYLPPEGKKAPSILEDYLPPRKKDL
jgi:hypothetical protein